MYKLITNYLFINWCWLSILSIVVDYHICFMWTYVRHITYIKKRYVASKAWAIARIFPIWPW